MKSIHLVRPSTARDQRLRANPYRTPTLTSLSTMYSSADFYDLHYPNPLEDRTNDPYAGLSDQQLHLARTIDSNLRALERAIPDAIRRTAADGRATWGNTTLLPGFEVRVFIEITPTRTTMP